MSIFHFLGAIAGSKGFFGPGFFADFKEGWVSSIHARRPRQAKKAPPTKVSRDTIPDSYVSVWNNIRPEDIWDLPDDNHAPVTMDIALTPDDIWDLPDDDQPSDVAGSVAGLTSLDSASVYPEEANSQPDTVCLLADNFIQRSYR